MLSILLVRPGSTEYDEEGRIKGSLDIPLSPKGWKQAAKLAADLAEQSIAMVYTATGEASEATAKAIADASGVKRKTLSKLTNLDLGLWQGKRIEEVRKNQSRIFKLWQESPECVCPPEGETIEDARNRVQSAMEKIRKKHPEGTLVLVAPEPLALLIQSYLCDKGVGDLWQAECRCGIWDRIDLPSPYSVVDS